MSGKTKTTLSLSVLFWLIEQKAMQKNSGWLDYQKLKLISAKTQHNYGNISVLGTHHWSLFPAVSTVYQALVAQTERNLENE